MKVKDFQKVSVGIIDIENIIFKKATILVVDDSGKKVKADKLQVYKKTIPMGSI